MTPELAAKLAGRRVVASVSGGKDSAALSLWLKEQGIEHERVFMDTGWEHESTYGYLRGELTRVIGPITEIHGPLGFAQLVRKKGMFPSRTKRFCTEELKVFPFRDWLRARQDAGEEFVNAVGIRRAESNARATSAEWEWAETFDCEVWRPLVDWSEQDVIDIHKRHGLLPNPLYLKGATRVGCWPCVFLRKSDLRLLARIDPERVGVIRQLEIDVNRTNKKGNASFYTLRPDSVKYLQAPIDAVVGWAKTERGGKKLPLFDEPIGFRLPPLGLVWCDMTPASASRIFDLILAGAVICVVLAIMLPLLADYWTSRSRKPKP